MTISFADTIVNVNSPEVQKEIMKLVYRLSSGIKRTAWTKDEDLKLLELKSEGKSRKEIGRALSRTAGSVNNRLYTLFNTKKPEDAGSWKGQPVHSTATQAALKRIEL